MGCCDCFHVPFVRRVSLRLARNLRASFRQSRQQRRHSQVPVGKHGFYSIKLAENEAPAVRARYKASQPRVAPPPPSSSSISSDLPSDLPSELPSDYQESSDLQSSLHNGEVTRSEVSLNAVPETSLLDTTANKTKGHLGVSGALAHRRPPSKFQATTVSHY